MLVTLELPWKCNMEPRCSYCTSAGFPSEVEWDLGSWVAGLKGLADQMGRLEIGFNVAECFAHQQYVDLMVAVSEHSQVNASSNLVADPKTYSPVIGRSISIGASYHPHYWESRGGVSVFVDRVRALKSMGVGLQGTSLVAWPPYLPRLREWRVVLEREGPHWSIPFAGQYEGRRYPDAYTEAEADLVAPHDAGRTVYRYQGSTRGQLCRAGSEYCCVGIDGEARPCYMVRSGESLGNVLKGTFRPLDGPRECRSDACNCDFMWEFIEAGGDQ